MVRCPPGPVAYVVVSYRADDGGSDVPLAVYHTLKEAWAGAKALLRLEYHHNQEAALQCQWDVPWQQTDGNRIEIRRVSLGESYANDQPNPRLLTKAEWKARQEATLPLFPPPPWQKRWRLIHAVFPEPGATHTLAAVKDHEWTYREWQQYHAACTAVTKAHRDLFSITPNDKEPTP